MIASEVEEYQFIPRLCVLMRSRPLVKVKQAVMMLVILDKVSSYVAAKQLDYVVYLLSCALTNGCTYMLPGSAYFSNICFARK